MKKLISLCILSIVGITYLPAQELGVRVGQVTGGDVAVDAIFSTGEFNRVHADAAFGNGGLGVDLLWDFLYRPLQIEQEDGFYWYVGAGPSVFFNDPFFLSAMSEVGVEYRLADVPISLSIDWRPTLVLVETTDLTFDFFGFNARYVF